MPVLGKKIWPLLATGTETERINQLIISGAAAAMNDLEIIAAEIKEFLASTERQLMITGESYYRNHTDIQNKKRLMSDGRELLYRSNTKLEHAFYRKMVDQLTGYLLTKTPSVTPEDENEQYSTLLSETFDRAFWRMFVTAGRGSVNQAIGWLQPYITDNGILKFDYIPGYEVIPLWRDNAHTALDAVIRTYEVIVYNGKEKTLVRKVELWTETGAFYYVYDDSGLYIDNDMDDREGRHFIINGNAALWDGRIPFIPLRFNDIEQPLLDLVKPNIDTYNMAASVHADMLADIPMALLSVRGYGGDPDTMLYNIMQSRIALLAPDGGIEYVTPQIETESVETMLTRIRRDIFSFGAGVDSQDDGQNNRSGTAMMHKNSDLDMICNNFEVELQETMQQCIWFANQYYLMTGQGDYTDVKVEVVFNRDIAVQESSVITDIKNSVGIISNRTLVANHPYVTDVDKEIKQLEEEENAAQEKWNEQQEMAAVVGGIDNTEANSNGKEE